MAANMAVITFKLVYLLNYILQISPEGVCHWVFWRHIYLYQIQYGHAPGGASWQTPPPPLARNTKGMGL